MLQCGSESIGEDDDEGGGGDSGKDVYNRRAEPMLVSLSDLYSEDNSISISDSRPSSSLAYTATNYCLKKSVYDFVLRRTFYSKQGLKDTCCSPIQTFHKERCSTELIDENVKSTSTKGDTFEMYQWALIHTNSQTSPT